MANVKIRKQCKACPWKRSTVPACDIPGGYDEAKHAALVSTIAVPGSFNPNVPLRVMACHETPAGRDQPCVGWVMNQLNEGNNLTLRFLARDGRFAGYRTVGKQCSTLEETLKR